MFLTFYSAKFTDSICITPEAPAWSLACGVHLGPPCGFGYCLFQGGGSAVVDSMLIGTPIVGFCNSCFVARYFMSILNLQSS